MQTCREQDKSEEASSGREEGKVGARQPKKPPCPVTLFTAFTLARMDHSSQIHSDTKAKRTSLGRVDLGGHVRLEIFQARFTM